MSSMIDAASLLIGLPEGLQAASDRGAIVAGRLLGLDAVAATVQVSVHGSEGVWVPAVSAVYPPNALVRVLRSAVDGGRLTACLGPVVPGNALVSGVVRAVDSGDGTLSVEALGSLWALPYNAGTYAVGTGVHVLRDPGSFGRPYLVSGPQGSFAGSDPGTPGGGTGNPGQTVTRRVVISPQWSGSWNGSRWDSWNANRPDYGGRSALWQGQGYGSPVMRGLAVYGAQIANLHADSIRSMTLTVKRVLGGSGTGGAGGPRSAVFQASPHGNAAPGGGPGGVGATAAVAVAAGGTVSLALPSSLFNGFRTGAYRGLALVGSDYLNLWGTAQAGAMALTIQYTVTR